MRNGIDQSRLISVGVVGLGTIAQVAHLPNLVDLSNRFRVVAVADLSAQLAEEISKRLPGPVRATTDWRDLCTDPAIDALLLLTPGDHSSMAADGLSAGKHVFAEKPLCYTVAEAATLGKQSRAAGLVLQVGYMKMHEAVLAKAREALGTIGDLRSVRVIVRHPSDESQLRDAGIVRFDDVDAVVPPSSQAADQTRVALGEVPEEYGRLYRDVLHGSLIHELSLLRAVLGHLPQSIESATAWPIDQLTSLNGGPPCVSAEGIFAADARFQIDWLWTPDQPTYYEQLEIVGTAGSIELRLPPPYATKRTAELVVDNSDGINRIDGGTDSAFNRELRAFHEAVSSGTPGLDAEGVGEDVAWLQRLTTRLALDRAVTVSSEAGSS